MTVTVREVKVGTFNTPEGHKGGSERYEERWEL